MSALSAEIEGYLRLTPARRAFADWHLGLDDRAQRFVTEVVMGNGEMWGGIDQATLDMVRDLVDRAT